MRFAFFLALLAGLAAPLAASAQGSAGGVVRGVVRSESTGESLAGAVVEVVNADGSRRALADSTGSYLLREVSAGRRLLRARHLGYAPLEMEVVVPGGREVRLDVTLRPAPVALPAVRVKGGGGFSPADSIAASPPDLARAVSRVMQASPGLSEVGLGETASGAPPGQEPPDPADVLYVRGTGADLKLVYLDGAPVYAPFPLGGLLDAFQPGVLRSADLHLGGAPARYDGGLSYVLDLRTRAAKTDRVHVEGAADLLSSRVLAEAPLGARSGLMVAARGVHGAGTGGWFGDRLPYGYRELLSRADIAVGTSLLSFTAFGNGEEVWLGDSPLDGAIRWGNTAGSARLHTSIGGTTADVTVARGDYDADLPLTYAPGTAAGQSRRTRVAADFARFSDGLAFRYGLAYDRQIQEYSRAELEDRTGASVAGAYVDAGWQLDPDLRVRAGLRADRFSLDSQFRFAPRISATWLMNEHAALTLAAGQYHQYLRAPESSLGRVDPGGSLERTRPMTLGSASHLALTLDQELGSGMRLGIEGYFKSFHDLPGAQESDGNASGVDLWVRRNDGPWNGWLGYSLAWVWSATDEMNRTRFAGRQLLSAGISGPVGQLGSVQFGLVYGAGLPYSSIQLSGGENDQLAFADVSTTVGDLSGAADVAPLLPEPNHPYLRIDLGVSRDWTGHLLGAPLSLSPYFRLLNSLGQRDALFYRYRPDTDPAPQPLLFIPVVPVAGVEVKF
jgi:hypothetical protein